MIIKKFVGGELEANGYIIYEGAGSDCYLIDTGYNGDKFINFVKENKLNPLGVIFTHHHYDHITAGPEVADGLDCAMYINDRDFESAKETLKERGGKLKSFSEDHVFQLGQKKLKVINTPGHTKGGICLIDEDDKIAFTGDTVFATEIGITNLDDGSPEEMAKSCYQISLWADDMMIYPGHGEASDMASVKEKNQEFKQALAMVK